MTWLVPKLNRRFQVWAPVNVPTPSGGFHVQYLKLLTVWGGVGELTYKSALISYVRHEQTSEAATHEILVRRGPIADIGAPAFGMGFEHDFDARAAGLSRAYDRGFSSGFDSIVDANPLKSDWFLFMECGSRIVGRMFRVMSVRDHGERGEYFRVTVREINEHSTGAPKA